MRRRLFAVAVLSVYVVSTSVAQSPDDPAPRAPLESPPPPPEAVGNESSLTGRTSAERRDAVTRLGESRGAVRMFPDRSSTRLSMCEGLYGIGDLDAAIEECHAAIKL